MNVEYLVNKYNFNVADRKMDERPVHQPAVKDMRDNSCIKTTY